MIRNYRDIGKPASVLMYTGAGLSQNPGGVVIRESELKQKVKLRINGSEWIESTASTINNIFRNVLFNVLDRKQYSKTGITAGIGVNNIQKFSLMESEYDDSLLGSHDLLAEVSGANVQFKAANLFRTVVSITGTINKGGVIKSAGFDVVTQLPNIGFTNIDVVSRIYDKVLVLPTVEGTSPYRMDWVYDPYRKQLLSIGYGIFNGYGDDIYTLDYDIDTGEVGTFVTQLPVRFPCRSSYALVSDGVNFIMTQTNESSFRIFSYVTQKVTTVTFNRSIINDPSLFWDYDNEVFRSYINNISYQYYDYNTQSWVTEIINGFTITLDGIVTTGTGGAQIGNIPLYQDGDMLYLVRGDYMGLSGDRYELIGRSNLTIDKRQFIENPSGTIVTAKFNSPTSPTSMNIKCFRIPQTAGTLVEIPNVEVQQGDSFEVEYTFEMEEQV